MIEQILQNNTENLARLQAIERYVLENSKFSFDDLMPHMLQLKDVSSEEELKLLVRIARINMQKAPLKSRSVFIVIEKEVLNKIEVLGSPYLYDEILEFGKAAVVAFDNQLNEMGFLDFIMKKIETISEAGLDCLYEILNKLLDRDCISIQYYINILPNLIQTAETSSYDKLVFILLKYLQDLLNRHTGLISAASRHNLPHTCIVLAGHPKLEIKSTALNLCASLVHDVSCKPYILENAQGLCLHLIHSQNKEICESAVRLLSAIGHTSAAIREQLMLKNLAPSLLTILTDREHKDVKRVLLELLKDIIGDRNQYLIDEIVENNLLLVICRICERDNHNRHAALECIKEIVEMRNEIYNAILRECGIIKFLGKVGDDRRCTEIAKEVEAKLYNRDILKNDTQSTNLITNAPSSARMNLDNQPAQLNAKVPQTSSNTIRKKKEESKQATQIKLPAKRKRHDSIDNPQPVKKPPVPQLIPKPAPSPPKNSGKRSAHKPKVTQSIKSGLIMPVSLIARKLRKLTGLRVSKSAPVYLTAILEYLTSEILSLASDSLQTPRRKRIQPRDLLKSILNDEELSKICPNLIIPESGHISL
jgi:histone H2A